MTSRLSREYKDLLNILSKKNNVEGTCSLLKKCIKENIIPTPFNLANTDLYDKFCDASKKRWDASTFFRIQILLDHHLKSLENLNNSYNTKKTTLFLNFNQSEENCFEKVLEKKIFKARKQFEKKHEKKIYHIRTPTDTEQSSQSTQSDSQGTQSSIDVSLTDNTTVINEEILLQEDINTACAST